MEEENGTQLVEMKDDFETALEDGSNVYGSFKLIKDITTIKRHLFKIDFFNNSRSFGVQFEI